MDLVPLSRPKLWKNKADFFRPFRSAAAASAAANNNASSSSNGENITPLYDPSLHRRSTSDEEPDLKNLNSALAALVDVFPDIEPEVFREMLVSVSDESRLQVVTEHLLTKKMVWARGRYRAATAPLATREGRRVGEKRAAGGRGGGGREGRSSGQREVLEVPEEAFFRSEGYKKAVKQVFYLEFKTLSHSSIRAVLAEQNFSYTLARPILQQLAAKSWRFSLSSFWPRKSPAAAAGDHPFISWQSNPGAPGAAIPGVKRTGNSQLDHELYELFVGPVLLAQRQAQLSGDFRLANQLNEKEAEDVEALFDCACCYSSVTFEQLSVCDEGCHQLCFECVRRTVNEALFGQGWARTVDLQRSSVRCFASTDAGCNGILPPDLVRRALSGGTDKDDAWNDFQLRAVSDVLSKSQLPLQRCPFCSYAEVKETPALQLRSARHTINYICAHTTKSTQDLLFILGLSLLIIAIPLLILLTTIWFLLRHTRLATYPPTSESWKRVYQKRQGLHFHCRNPSCSRSSCTRCLARWRDPHICFENEKTSLRTAIEASATAAVKRTCPKCLLSFVKSSGCNKLVCNCGYTMCYICRAEITSKEGYAHFCQHFRPHGGRCAECERCDLYGDEDEEVAIRRAAEQAENAWREKEGRGEGVRDEVATKAMVEVLIGQSRGGGRWEACLDAVVDCIAA